MAGVVPPERGGALHQCFPLYRYHLPSQVPQPILTTMDPLKSQILLSLLLALNNPKVNYFSLDIEGAELQVLRSVPWHLVDIEVQSICISNDFISLIG